MRIFPSLNPYETKICSACRLSFARSDCHKNRYGEYLCKPCRASGVKSTRGGRLRHGSQRAVLGFWLSLGIAVAVAMAAWMLYAVFEHLSILPRFLQALFN